jgi:DNA cross-link repair 1A protein
MNTPTSIASKGKSVIVTLFDANHCPGAVMFLFEIGNKKVLHVGDFRFNRELMMQVPQLLSFSNGSSRLDEIFLDTTYCDVKYTLPTQAEAIRAAIEVAEKEMLTSKKDKSSKTLFLFGSYTIGKERIYMSVAERLQMKVFVDTRRYQILSSLEWPKERMQMFTTNKSDTNLWVVPLGSVNFKQMPDYLEEANKNKVFVAPYGRIVGFRPTGEISSIILLVCTYIGNQLSSICSIKSNRLDLQGASKRTNYACSFNLGQESHNKQDQW